MNSLYSMLALDHGADLAQFLMVSGDVEIVYGQGLAARHTIDCRSALDGGLENCAVEGLVEAAEQITAPISAKDGERREQRIGTPVRHASHDQVPSRSHARDRFAVRDMLCDQPAGQRAHA